MTYAEWLARNKWLEAQLKWHARRGPSKWHWQQQKWFKREQRRHFNLGFAVTATYRKHRGRIVSGLITVNPLFERLNPNG